MKMTQTQRKQMQKKMAQADAFVARLSRDLYVARAAEQVVLEPEKLAHACMELAVAYFEALQTFRKPAPAPVAAPVDANGSPVEIEG